MVEREALQHIFVGQDLKEQMAEFEDGKVVKQGTEAPRCDQEEDIKIYNKK